MSVNIKVKLSIFTSRAAAWSGDAFVQVLFLPAAKRHGLGMGSNLVLLLLLGTFSFLENLRPP